MSRSNSFDHSLSQVKEPDLIVLVSEDFKAVELRLLRLGQDVDPEIRLSFSQKTKGV